MNDFTTPPWMPIRDTIPLSRDAFYEHIMNIAIYGIGLQADKVLAPKNKRIGIFGPYPRGGKKIIVRVARAVSKLGYGALTTEGFYPPKSKEFHPIEEIMPPLVRRTIMALGIPDYIYLRHFPRLTVKAIHHLSPLRGQISEIQGCASNDIPMLGFIITRKIDRLPKNRCSYLVKIENCVECYCPNPDFCFYLDLKPYCPFYEEVAVPWDTKQLFLNRMNPMIATKGTSYLTPTILENFLEPYYVHHI